MRALNKHSANPKIMSVEMPNAPYSNRYHTLDDKTMNETNLPTTELKTKPNIGNRILAGIIDYFIIFAFFFIYIYTFGEPDSEGGYTVNGLPGLVPILFWGIMTVGFEQWFGATLGNLLVGLKPISVKKERDQQTFGNYLDNPTFGQSFKRHLLDPIDMTFFGLVGIVIIKNTELNQRVGDIWGKTAVIENKSKEKEKTYGNTV